MGIIPPRAKFFSTKQTAPGTAKNMTNWKNSIFDMETKIKALEHHYQSLIVATNAKNAHLRIGLQLAHDEMLQLQSLSDASAIHYQIDQILESIRSHLAGKSPVPSPTPTVETVTE